jgi:hypothetical protein
MGTAMLIVAGCGGGASSSGTGGQGGGGATGAGGSAGVTGAGGAAATGGAGGSGPLPTCAILALPATDGGACTALVAAGPLVTSVRVVDNFQSGVVEDGGVQVQPEGGAILDGDYDLVRWENTTAGRQTRRTIRVFGAGSYVEWDAAVMNGDAGFLDYRYDTQNAISGHTFAFASVFCSSGLAVLSYGYTVTGDDLVFFDYTGLLDGNGDVSSVDTYRRTCTRP